MIDARHFHQILGQRPRLDIVSLGLGHPPQKVHRVGVAQVKFERGQDVFLGREDLFIRVTPIGHEQEVGDGRADDLFVLGGDEETGETDELEFGKRDDSGREESVDEVDSEEEGLGKETELVMHLDEPVCEETPHLPFQMGLLIHVLDVGHAAVLQGGAE